MRKRFDVLLTPAVLVSLAVLLANDFVLKAAFHDALTGKLSDFAGLFVFGVFGCAVFPRHRGRVAALTTLGFVFWKSPAVQPLIDAWNGLGLVRVGRVVDVTDLVALLAVPIACAYRGRAGEAVRWRRVLAPGVAAACVFAFAATSVLHLPVPIAGVPYAVPLTRGEVLRRIYDLRLGFHDADTPPGESAQGPDTLNLTLPPAVDASGAVRPAWDVITVTVVVADAPGGESTLALVSASGSEVKRMAPDSVRRRFEAEIVEHVRRNEPGRVHVSPYVAGNEPSFAPRILAPRSLAEPRASVTVSLARPAYVALVEVTPDGAWRLLYPVTAEDEGRLDAGSHTLATACAGEPDADPAAPGRPVPPCARARAVTPRDVGMLSRTPRPAGGCDTGPSFGVGGPGMLVLVATDVPLRRATLQAHVDGYCGSTYAFSPELSPLVKAVRASGGRHWAVVEGMLRR